MEVYDACCDIFYFYYILKLKLFNSFFGFPRVPIKFGSRTTELIF